MAKKKYAKGLCFCRVEVPPPTNQNDVFTCPGCGAKYWAEEEGEVNPISDGVAGMFNLPLEQVETKVIKGYDDDPDGNELCLVFARPKPAEAND